MCVLCQLEAAYSELEDMVKEEFRNKKPENVPKLLAASHLIRATEAVLHEDFEEASEQVEKAHASVEIAMASEDDECPCTKPEDKKEPEAKNLSN